MQAVPLGFFLFLAELAAGAIIITTLLDWDGEVSGGYLFLNGIFPLGFAAAGIWLRSVLPVERLLSYAAAAPWARAELGVWAVFALLTAAQLFLLKGDRRRQSRLAGTCAAVVGIAGLVTSAVAYAPPLVSPALVASNFLAAALALGAVWSGMMLGHWYLVTPLLSTRPLLRLNAAIGALLAAQAVLLGIVGAAHMELLGAWLTWLRGGVGILLPLLLTVMVWRTARVRSMMSATGLLYVALGAMLAGEIIAKALFFLAGVPL
jgi:hypothetical protein